LYELALQPDIQEKLYQEIDKVLGNEEPTIDKYYEMSYMRNAVQETLRRHPPVVLIPKMTRTKTTIGSYAVPANTQVYLNAYQVQHDERYWKEPQSFIPERFDTDSEYCMKRHVASLIPFSIGQRKCIGSRFSEIETAMIMAKIIKQYRIILPKDDPKMQTPDILSGKIATINVVTLRPVGLKVELVPRQ
jgi:cytochrome P450 family 3 subfamily A